MLLIASCPPQLQFTSFVDDIFSCLPSLLHHFFTTSHRNSAAHLMFLLSPLTVADHQAETVGVVGPEETVAETGMKTEMIPEIEGAADETTMMIVVAAVGTTTTIVTTGRGETVTTTIVPKNVAARTKKTMGAEGKTKPGKIVIVKRMIDVATTRMTRKIESPVK